MKINTLSEKALKYLNSIFYPISLAIIAFCIWIAPSNWAYIPAVFYSLFAFLPLISKEGKCYLPLILFIIILPNSTIGLNNIPGEVILVGFATTLSCIIHLIITKPKLIKGEFFYSFILLNTILLISYLYNMLKDGNNDFKGILYIIALYVILLIGMFFSTTLGRKDNIPFFSDTISCLAIIITTQVIFSIFLNYDSTPLLWDTFNLGWALNGSTASTILCLSLPFQAMNIAKKRLWSFFSILYSFIGILLISSYSGLICLIISIIPLIFLSFKTYGNKYPYLVLISILLTIGVIALLVGYNELANSNILNSLRSLYPLSDTPAGRLNNYEEAVKIIQEHPILGVSVASRTSTEGSIQLLQNSFLNTMVLGGSFGLIAFILFKINIYYTALKKKSNEKFLFMLFLLQVELIGYVDNALYLIPVLLLFIIANTVYQMSDKPQTAIIHQEFFDNYNQNSNMDLR